MRDMQYIYNKTKIMSIFMHKITKYTKKLIKFIKKVLHIYTVRSIIMPIYS